MNPKSLLRTCMQTLSKNHRYINMTILPVELADKLQKYMTGMSVNDELSSRGNFEPCSRIKYVLTNNDNLTTVCKLHQDEPVSNDMSESYAELDADDCFCEISEMFENELIYLHDDLNEIRSCTLNCIVNSNKLIRFGRHDYLVEIANINKKLLNYMFANKLCSRIIELPAYLTN